MEPPHVRPVVCLLQRPTLTSYFHLDRTMPASAPQLATNPATRPTKRMRRTATAVLAGQFDPRPARDVLTSLLNGVGPYRPIEGEEEEKRLKRRERKEKNEADAAAAASS